MANGSIVFPMFDTMKLDDEHRRQFLMPLHLCDQTPGCEVSFDSSLEQIGWSAYQVRVDDTLVVFDISDYLDTAHYAGAYLQFRKTYTSVLHPYPCMDSLGPIHVLDWRAFAEAQEIPITRLNSTVLDIQGFGDERGPRGPGPRRHLCRDTLLDGMAARIGSGPGTWLVDTRWSSQWDYWCRARHCLVSVHAPGSWPHCLDKAQYQLMGLGVCTISPDIQQYCLDTLPVAGRDYIQCADDYSDLVDLVDQCYADRERCMRVGRNARKFFETYASPTAVWTYIRTRTAVWANNAR